MISLVSAITHDLDHPGVNQAFLIATSNHLASLYDVSLVTEILTSNKSSRVNLFVLDNDCIG